ncbi:hypothetical protein ACFL6I_02640 [candidate division KSB1 bacterium]
MFDFSMPKGMTYGIDEDVLNRTVWQAREINIVAPIFAEQKDPVRIPENL